MLEDKIQKLTEAVEALTEVLRNQQPVAAPAKAPKAAKKAEPLPEAAAPAPAKEEAPPAPVEAPKAQSKPTVTLEDLRHYGQQVLDAGKTAELLKLAKDMGVKRISEVSPDRYAEVIEKLKAIANG